MRGLLVIGLVWLVGCASAEPIAQLERDDVRIVIYTEPCELKERVVNLPHRAEWLALGKVFQGCWALSPFGTVVMFFEDLTATGIPVNLFKQVRSI